MCHRRGENRARDAVVQQAERAACPGLRVSRLQEKLLPDNAMIRDNRNLNTERKRHLGGEGGFETVIST